MRPTDEVASRLRQLRGGGKSGLKKKRKKKKSDRALLLRLADT